MNVLEDGQYCDPYVLDATTPADTKAEIEKVRNAVLLIDLSFNRVLYRLFKFSSDGRRAPYGLPIEKLAIECDFGYAVSFTRISLYHFVHDIYPKSLEMAVDDAITLAKDIESAGKCMF